MSPDALRERKITFGDLTATQSVTVHSDNFYVITCFNIPLGDDAGSTFHSKGSHLAFADAAKLEDEAWRTQLAESHLRVMAQELRTMTDVAEAQLAKLAIPVDARIRLVDALHVEGLKQLERAAPAADQLPEWMNRTHGYPPGWRTCRCGLPTLDGHLTCGRAECGTQAEAERRG